MPIPPSCTLRTHAPKPQTAWIPLGPEGPSFLHVTKMSEFETFAAGDTITVQGGQYDGCIGKVVAVSELLPYGTRDVTVRLGKSERDETFPSSQLKKSRPDYGGFDAPQKDEFDYLESLSAVLKDLPPEVPASTKALLDALSYKTGRT
jgi:hypothetical protein